MGADAAEVSWQPVRKLAASGDPWGFSLAFDHDQVVDDALYRAGMAAARSAPFA